MAAKLDKALAVAVEYLRPPPLVPLSTWLEDNVRLPYGLSAEGGPLCLWPTQRGIADALTDPALERVTLIKAARCGFTSLLTGLIGHHCRNDPAAVLCVLPTESDCRDYIAADIEPIFEASPSLRGVLGEPGKGEAGRNLITHRMFEGGSLKIVAAKAPRNLRRHTARILLVDEADACEIGAEGNPIALAEKRTLSFANRKIIVGSTPLDADTSHVLRLWAQSDQRVFELPCPHCGDPFELLWNHIEWPDGKPAEACAVCPSCGGVIEEGQKRDMVEAGAWRITRPDVKGHAGFRLNALVSLLPNASWAKLAAEYLTAKDDAEELRVFVNTVLAEPWREAVDDVDDADLASCAVPISLEAIPEDVLAITCGVDVQDDRLEVSTFGWSKDGVPFVLDHRALYGAPDSNEAWLDLDEHLKDRWRHPRGGWLKIDATCVDAGSGSHYDVVTRFCQARTSRRVFAIKGASGFGRPAISRSRAKRGLLFIIGVDGIKTNILGRLAKPGAIRFSDQLEPIYFEQLCSERRVTRMSRGKPVVRLEAIPGRENHTLDSAVYAFAAKAALTINLDAREAELSTTIPPSPKRPAVHRSAFMERGRV
ncbi:phage terminase large subunit family protein [Methyloceanibacter caenitepidi]|uniref:Phage terminase, large subunit n=1 Tax=Methyloceanibacter caenitepidi TaxID=1384459 RepID=A0A0A8K3K3_9HYPH|nr:terminase gpA endonuclease subunit [Methyloceanibacter caenitepidi]BAQ17475.1 phage terminase, large subunit [Methyloceanibacter caenitepidi]